MNILLAAAAFFMLFEGKDLTPDETALIQQHLSERNAIVFRWDDGNTRFYWVGREQNDISDCAKAVVTDTVLLRQLGIDVDSMAGSRLQLMCHPVRSDLPACAFLAEGGTMTVLTDQGCEVF